MRQAINLENPSRYPIDSVSLKRAARVVLADHLNDETGELSIVIADATTIRAMNLRFAKSDAPTDVLSFPAESMPQESGDCARYLGDIVIAYDYAMDQAKKTRTTLGDVLCLLVIHGTLHLLGYDHDTQLARESMWAAQAAALRAIQVDPAMVETYGNIDDD